VNKPTLGSAVFQRRLDYNYPRIVGGEGIYLYDREGKRYIDAAGGAAVACLGYGNREIVRRVSEAIARYGYIHASQFSSDLIENFARKLVAVAPSRLQKVFFVSSGSEATEAAVKLAYQYHVSLRGDHDRRKIIYTVPSYHGSTMFALSLTGKTSDQMAFRGLLTSFPSIPSATCNRCPYGKTFPACDLYCADALEKKILAEGPDSIAAFIIEPIVGSSLGVSVPPDGYLARIRSICDRYGVLLIFDEIMCGFGRTGKWFASQHWAVEPDISTMGKGLAAGLVPLSAVFCSETIFETIKRTQGNFKHGHTFTNHQFSLAVGDAVFDYIQENDLVTNVDRQGAYLLTQLEGLRELSFVGDVRGKGLFAGFELVRYKQSNTPFERSAHFAEHVLQTAMKKGLNLYFSIGYTDDGTGDSILLAPPYTVTRAEIDEIMITLRRVLESVYRKIDKAHGGSGRGFMP